MPDEEDLDGLAAFDALGGQLAWDELTRLLSSGYRTSLTGQVALLLKHHHLDGDDGAADQVVQASFTALQQRGPLPQQEARIWFYRAAVSRTRPLARYSHDIEALVLRYRVGLPEQETAVVMGVTIRAVRAHLAGAISSGLYDQLGIRTPV